MVVFGAHITYGVMNDSILLKYCKASDGHDVARFVPLTMFVNLSVALPVRFTYPVAAPLDDIVLTRLNRSHGI